MRLDPVSRLEKINEAMVNLFERSRAAQREAQRAANRQPVAIRDKGGLDAGAARASQNTGTTMVTGRDGKLYQQGADPTRAQPGSALANQPAPQSREDAFLAAQPKMQRPAPVARPAARPAAPAPRTAPAAPAAPKAQGNIQLPAAAATALGQGDPAMKAYVGQLDQGDSWRGQTKKPEPTPAKSAAAPAPKATTPNFVEITPEEQSRVSGETAKAPASAATTQTSGKGSGSLEQDVGGMLRSVGLVPSAGGSPKAPTANTPAAYGSQDQRPENQRNYQSVYFGSQNQSTVSSPKASASAPTKSAAKNTEYPEYNPNKPLMTSRIKGNLYPHEVRPGEHNTITRDTAHGWKTFLPLLDQDTVNIRKFRGNPSATNWNLPGNENPTADKNRESFRQIAQQKTEVPQHQSSTQSKTASPANPGDWDLGLWFRQLFGNDLRKF